MRKLRKIVVQQHGGGHTADWQYGQYLNPSCLACASVFLTSLQHCPCISQLHVTSPLVESGLLTTAVSTTAGCSINAFSTSDGPIRYLQKYVLQRRQGTQPLGLRTRKNKTPQHPSWSRNSAHPLELMISSVRPKKWKYPSESLIPRSPRSQKSPRILASVFLGFS